MGYICKLGQLFWNVCNSLFHKLYISIRLLFYWNITFYQNIFLGFFKLQRIFCIWMTFICMINKKQFCFTLRPIHVFTEQYQIYRSDFPLIFMVRLFYQSNLSIPLWLEKNLLQGISEQSVKSNFALVRI